MSTTDMTDEEALNTLFWVAEEALVKWDRLEPNEREQIRDAMDVLDGWFR